jgi:hypothetical protein
MSKKRRAPKRKPDEQLVKGPFRFARYGRFLSFSAHWPAGTFEKAQAQNAARLPEVAAKTDALVLEIADLVSSLRPEKLLHRAWWEIAIANLLLDHKERADDVVAQRMLDYAQSIIASVPPRPEQREDVSEQEWSNLREKVEALFRVLLLEYQICRTAASKLAGAEFDKEMQEFRFRAEAVWCTVRGTRFQVHQTAYLRDMFLPFSALLQESFGISAEEFVAEIGKILHALTFGFGEAAEEFATLQDDVTNALEQKVVSGAVGEDVDLGEAAAALMKEKGWEGRETVLGRLVGMDLFDVEKTCALPRRLLEALTWSPGEDAAFFAEGQFRGWPLRVWPVSKRPFIKLRGRIYCFDLYSLLDNIYRVMKRILLSANPEHGEKWNEIQKAVSEELPLKYLARVLAGARVLRGVHYPYRSDEGAKQQWCEVDGLLIYDDHLFVVEVKAGAFTAAPPATDLPAYVESLKGLVLKPALQGRRFTSYLRSADTVRLFDQDHCEIASVAQRDIRHVTMCAVTLDPFTELAAQIQHLRKVGVDVGTEPVWSISIDDLRAYADVFQNPLLFLHFVEQRMRAFRSEVLRLDDEFAHLGLYVKHNDYTSYAEKLKGESHARMIFDGYRTLADDYFRGQVEGGTDRAALHQDMPSRFFEIIDVLSRGGETGRAAVSSYLLNFAGTFRETIATEIDAELKRQPSTKRPKPFSSPGGGAGVTVFCWTSSWAKRDADIALRHARKVLLVSGDERWLLLELSYSDAGALQAVHWQWVALAEIPSGELSTLRAEAEKLRDARVKTALSENGKIGKNDPCPCGTGKKYKKCCLGP